MSPDEPAASTNDRITGWWIWWAAWSVVIAVGAAWWWLMPGGFPASHPRFWVNQALPPLAVVAAVLGLTALQRRWTALASASALTLPIALLAGTITGAALFPVSLGAALAASAVATVALGWLWIAAWGRGRLFTREAAIAGAAAAMIGAGVAWSQRAPRASTRPLGEPAPAVSGELTGTAPRRVGPRATVIPPRGIVRVEGGVSLEIAPLLQFISTSPDRCWTLFAPEGSHRPAPWRLTQVQHAGDAESGWSYAGDAERRLWVRASGEAVDIDASTELAAPVYSHLNSFTRMTMLGHRRLTLEFAAAPGQSIDVLPSDYPVGRPQRFAYVGDDEVLRVMEATSGEKGPFTELAAGPLPDGAPLVIIVRDEDRPVWRLTLFDWNTQRGRSLSPTAGWSVPGATIEFTRGDDPEVSVVEVWISLASTSVGRGFDSIGHSPGIYRNRIRIEPLR